MVLTSWYQSSNGWQDDSRLPVVRRERNGRVSLPSTWRIKAALEGITVDAVWCRFHRARESAPIDSNSVRTLAL